MRFPLFFIDRPIFAAVLSILLMLVGAVAYFQLPVAQYPEIAPPTIEITASYPGAGADVVSATVATPIEQELNGVENMLYLYSQATDDGRLVITVTFALGTDLDAAQVLVQNRVSIAEPRLPEAVRRLGVTTRKSSPDMLMVVHLFSPDESRDQLYISNYALLQIRDVMARLDGVGSINVFGAREYSMRIWLDPSKMAARNIAATDVVNALRAQNVQIAGGVLNQPPIEDPGAFQVSVRTLGRLAEPDQFANVVVATADDGAVTYVRDVARVELGAQSYATNAYLDTSPAVALAVFQRPGSNALETSEKVLATMERLKADFPAGLDYTVIYNPTEFIAESVEAVYHTIIEAVLLVIVVVFVFLQSWRAALIPILAIPVSLIGTFAVMSAFGFSLNSLTLFGLVLAIGIVVDDAIVVVENVERELSNGHSPKEAARRTMLEVGGALVAISLVLCAVFIPAAFITGISGQFFRQFALTIATATIISMLNSLTLSPAVAALLLKPHEEGSARGKNPLNWFFDKFNIAFDGMATGYGRLICSLVRKTGLVMMVYVALIALAGWRFAQTPTGFIPPQDQGYVIVAITMPPGASLARTDAVVKQATDIILSTDGFEHTAGFTGFNGATSTNSSSAAAVFATMKPFDDRASATQLQGALQNALGVIKDAFIIVIQPPSVRGIGATGGLRLMLQDRVGRGPEVLNQVTQEMIAAANADPRIAFAFSFYETSTPQLFMDIDRVKAQQLGVPITDVFSTLEVYLGSAFVNDFNYLGRTYRVTAQADGPFRRDQADITDLRARSRTGAMVPLGSLATFEPITGTARQPRYNLYPAAELDINVMPGVSSGEAIAAIEAIAEEVLPAGLSYEWTGIAYQQISAGNTAAMVFLLAVVLVFLLLAAQYESWLLPLAIILIVPMCLLSAVLGVNLRGLDINILTQTGLLVLVGLACKNAILIVEFAKQLEDQGRNRFDAASEAGRLRLRPILMTSFAFILGVVPLLTATGAGAEMRQALGTAVFYGMLGVTFFGLLLTPVFYSICRGFAPRSGTPAPEESPPPAPEATL